MDRFHSPAVSGSRYEADEARTTCACSMLCKTVRGRLGTVAPGGSGGPVTAFEVNLVEQLPEAVKTMLPNMEVDLSASAAATAAAAASAAAAANAAASHAHAAGVYGHAHPAANPDMEGYHPEVECDLLVRPARSARTRHPRGLGSGRRHQVLLATDAQHPARLCTAAPRACRPRTLGARRTA